MPLIEHCRRFGTCLIFVCILQSCTGCAKGDDRETVALINKHLSPRAIKTVDDENGMKRVYWIALPDNRDALEILPHLDKLERLTSLTIAYEKLKDEDLKALPALPHLREFRMGSNLVTDDGFKFLAGMTELRRLDLLGTKVRGPGLAHLKDSSKLEWLDLSGTPLDDRAIPHVVKNFRQLKRFEFLETNVTADGLLQLAELPWLTTIGPPDDVAGPRGHPNRKERLHDLLTTYVKAYKEAKRKAREAGEDVPPDHIGPFGLIE